MSVTGWDNGLCQDYSRGLSRWFASRIDARHTLRRWRNEGATMTDAKELREAAQAQIDRWKKLMFGPVDELRAALAQPAEGGEAVGYEVWWGLGQMRSTGQLFTEREKADEVASRIKSKTEVRPVYRATPPASQEHPPHRLCDCAACAASFVDDATPPASQERAARKAAQEQLYAERERHTAEVKALQAEIGRLKASQEQAAEAVATLLGMCRQWNSPEERAALVLLTKLYGIKFEAPGKWKVCHSQAQQPEKRMVPIEAVHEVERERDYWRTRAKTMIDHANGEFWGWQGDGEDHLESMANSMPVVIRADQLRELLAQQPSGETFDQWLKRERPAGCVSDMERGWKACVASQQPSGGEVVRRYTNAEMKATHSQAQQPSGEVWNMDQIEQACVMAEVCPAQFESIALWLGNETKTPKDHPHA